MDVFLMVRRKKTTIFVDAKETTTIKELKKIIQGILKVDPDEQQLSNESGSEIYPDEKCLGEYLSGTHAHAQNPATIGLCIRDDGGDFESLEICSLSSPPELPEVMKTQDPPSHDQN